MNRTIKVLVVDDSAFMRKALKRIIESDPEFEVVASAREGREALEIVGAVNPDAITMDVEMPGMNGLQTLQALRQRYRVPVIMVSSITKAGGDMAIRCLEAGALDVVSKPESYVSMNISLIAGDLISKLRTAVRRDVVVMPHPGEDVRPTEIQVFEKPVLPENSQRVVTIGSSTGGPMALNKFLSGIPANLPAGIVIVQHMPAGNFIQSLAERLNASSPFSVRVAQDGDIIQNGVAYIGAIGKHITFERSGPTWMIRLRTLPKDHLHCPAVDVMFESAGRLMGPANISCILTGMGADGTEGLRAVYERHGFVIAQSEASCAIYGMPRSAVEAGLVHEITDLEQIPYSILRRLNADRNATVANDYLA